MDAIESWNSVVKALWEAKAAWEIHKKIMKGSQIELLPIEAQRKLRYAIHRATDFDKMLLGFINHWRVSGGLESLIIPVKEKKDATGTKRRV